MRYLIGALCALALLATQAGIAQAAPVVYCGTVKANSITFGQGSGPRTFELDVTSGPGGGGRFSVPETIPLPTIGSYLCGQFEQGVPMNGLVAVLRPGDAGYVAQPGIATAAPTITPVPTSAPTGTSVSATLAPIPTPSPFTFGFLVLLLAAIAVLVVAGGLLLFRSRRATAA